MTSTSWERFIAFRLKPLPTRITGEPATKRGRTSFVLGGLAAYRALLLHRQRFALIGAMFGAAVLCAGLFAPVTMALNGGADWPLAHRFSLAALDYPGLRSEVIGALLALSLAPLLILLALVWPASRYSAWAGAAVVAALAWPHLQLLVVPAVPTSYFRSSTGFTAASIARGLGFFRANCAGCHNSDGRQGQTAAAGPLTPPSLTGPHLRMHTDGELFWVISRGAPGMPAFADELPEIDRWAVIDYLRAANAGASSSQSGGWVAPVPAPHITARCDAGRTIEIGAPTGRGVQLVSSNVPAPQLIGPQLTGDASGPEGKPIVVMLADRAGVVRHDGICVADDPDAWAAYAVQTGTAPELLYGTQWLVGADGMLRSRWRPGEKLEWTQASRPPAEDVPICSISAVR